jgi:phage terminase large subunit
MDGPAGTGKTTAILELINALMDKYPGARALIVRKDRASMNETVLVTLESNVLGMHHPSMVDAPGRANRETYDYPNGSTIVVGGLNRPEKTFSGEYDIVAVFEAIECDRNDVELLLRTLRHGKIRPKWNGGRPFHRLVMDTNPGPDGHWLNRSDEWLDRILSRHEDNPRMWDEGRQEWTPEGAEYIANLDALTGHRRERLRFGRWVSADGIVYPEFDKRIHMVNEMPAGWRSWPKYRAIDFGYNDPFVCQWWAVGDDAMYLYRELYQSRRIVEDHARDIVRLSEGESFVTTVADHDKEDRETLARHGVPTSPAIKDIATGLDAVRERLKLSGNKTPRLYLLKGALVGRDQTLYDAKRPTCTEEEFDCYLWAKRVDKTEKDLPVDRDNHGMDTMRYAVRAVSGGGGFFFGVSGVETSNRKSPYGENW